MGTSSGLRVAVIGGGPGGYVAAIRAAQLGASVTLIEKTHIGGTCLNEGCIPTKALLHAAQTAQTVRAAAGCGIHAHLDGVCWPEVMAFKQGVCTRLTTGVSSLLKSSGVTVMAGSAHFVRRNAVLIKTDSGETTLLEADRFILATGSVPVMPPIPGLRESRFVMDSTGALAMQQLPADITIIGGGVIGLEMAAAYQGLGSRVTIIEALPAVAPTIDAEMAALMAKALTAAGVQIRTGCRVVKTEDRALDALITVETAAGQDTLQASSILCAIGRRPNLGDLAPEAAGIAVENGHYRVDEYLRTSVSGIYAVGDCTGMGMLAHTASAMGEAAAENALGGNTRYCPACVPSCIYGMPEYAGVGLTEQQAKEQGIACHIGRFPLSGNGRAIASQETDGMVKVIIGNELNEVLGVHIVAANATEMIGEGTMAIHLEATAEEIIGAIHPHPTMSEAVREAVLAAEGRAIHMPNRAGRKTV